MASHDRLFETFEAFLTGCVGMTEADEVDRLLELELSMSQTKSIFVLSHAQDAMPITALAAKLGMSAPTAGRTVDQLVKAGLAERHEDPADRRVKLVSATKAGREIAERHFEAHRATFREIFSRLSADEADRLADALRPLLATIQTTPLEQETPA